MSEFIYNNNGIKLINGECLDVMGKFIKYDYKVDVILTSPPYNTSKQRGTWKKEQKTHYDISSVDNMTDEEYVDFSINLFKHYDDILNQDGVILYNLSYSTSKPYQMYQVINEIMNNTTFCIADTIMWKKKSALPNNMSVNRLTRICEFVFVFCRKDELKTFKMNKTILSVRPNGIKQYNTYYNYVEAKNNDGSNDLNKATYSSELCEHLLKMYATKDSVVYDSFMGTGTTALACYNLKLKCIGSEISLDQCNYAKERLKSNLKK